MALPAKHPGLNVYLHNAETQELLLADWPVEMDYSTALQFLLRFRAPRSFLGVSLSADVALQFFLESSGLYRVELLDMKQRYVTGCSASAAVAAKALEAAFMRREIVAALAPYMLRWSTQEL